MLKTNLLQAILGASSLLLMGHVVASGQPVTLKTAFSTSCSADIYPTNGVHSDCGCDASNNHCIAERKATDPSDPQYPSQWISDWTMFRVTQNYTENPPPYTNPPSTLAPADYTVSYGTTYYDANYVPADQDGIGAMMEHYEKYCLPIFPIKDNNFTCSFISLGNKEPRSKLRGIWC